MFNRLDANSDGMISQDEFIEYFREADKVIRLPACGGEAEDGTLEFSEEPDPGETMDLPDEELAEAFPGLCAEGETVISTARLTELLPLHMIVLKETAMTDGPVIKDSNALRRLGLEEIVEVIGGPIRERVAGVQRTQVRALRDGVEGWVSAVGNAGTVFLKMAGSRFKVQKPTFMTDSLELESDAKDTMRRLTPGEELEVLQWPRKESKS